jgi:hypothetical protein
MHEHLPHVLGFEPIPTLCTSHQRLRNHFVCCISGLALRIGGQSLLSVGCLQPQTFLDKPLL